jgi:hypothetical protein
VQLVNLSRWESASLRYLLLRRLHKKWRRLVATSAHSQTKNGNDDGIPHACNLPACGARRNDRFTPLADI